jgi:hypothetical protein
MANIFKGLGFVKSSVILGSCKLSVANLKGPPRNPMDHLQSSHTHADERSSQPKRNDQTS